MSSQPVIRAPVSTTNAAGGGGGGGNSLSSMGGDGGVRVRNASAMNNNHNHNNDNNTISGSTINGSLGSPLPGGGGQSSVQTCTLAQPQPAPLPSFYKLCGCVECYAPRRESLEYDYTYDDVSGNKPAQAYPRIRERGEFYIDSYNGEPWSCSFGTAEKNGTWFNSSDQAGSIMSALVWVLMLYSSATVTALTVTEGIPVACGMTYNVLCFMALACHAKTSLTDPGSVPLAAIPSERQRLLKDSHSMCGQCQTFKPPMSHHCRICNRCISRMDHHCPWMNNCVGGNNLKHFLLFLVYTWTCAAYALSLFGLNYFFCSSEDCTFHPIVVHLVRVMTMLCVGAFLFTSSMLMNVCYGLMTGIGTIDRLKKRPRIP